MHLIEGDPTDLAPYLLTRPVHYTSGTTGRPKGVTTGLWDEDTARQVFEDEASVWHFDPQGPAHGLLADVPHRVDPLRQRHAPGGRVVGHPEPLRRRNRPRYPPAPPTHDGLPRPHAPAAHSAKPRPGRRRDVRLAAPPRPRRGALSGDGQARRHGTGPARRRLGVLRFHRGAVHGVPARGVARAPRHRRPGPPGPASPHRPGRRRRHRRRRHRHVDTADRPGRHHLVRHAALRPLQLLGEPRGHRRRLERVGLHRRRPRPPRSGRLPLPDRPAPRPHHQRGRQRLSRRGRERPGRRRGHRRGGGLRPPRRAVGPAGLRRLRRRRPAQRVGRGGPAGRRVGPPRPVQAAQVVLRHRGPAPHGHRQAHTAGRPRAPRTRPGRERPTDRPADRPPIVGTPD